MPLDDAQARRASLQRKIDETMSAIQAPSRRSLTAFLSSSAGEAALLERRAAVDFEAVAAQSAADCSMELLSVDLGARVGPLLGTFARLAPASMAALHRKFFASGDAFAEAVRQAAPSAGAPVLLAVSGLAGASASARDALMGLIDDASALSLRVVLDAPDLRLIPASALVRCQHLPLAGPDAPATPARPDPGLILGSLLRSGARAVLATDSSPAGFVAMAAAAAHSLGYGSAGMQILAPGIVELQGDARDSMPIPRRDSLNFLDAACVLDRLQAISARRGSPVLLAVSGIKGGTARQIGDFSRAISKSEHPGVRVVFDAAGIDEAMREPTSPLQRSLLSLCRAMDESPAISAKLNRQRQGPARERWLASSHAKRS